jgi:GH25 family lysozyme M1 (1,4-beta-N-acetylmuramidase)
MKKGIDISKHQGTVDFSKVKSSGVEFVILRSSYRQTTDQKFFEYVKGCNDNGIPILGVYHFIYALNDAKALEEAKFCVEQVKKAGLKDVYIFSDFEYDTVEDAAEKGVTLTKDDCNNFTKIFCDYVKSQGFKTGIYSNIDFYKNWYKQEVITKYPLWLADYTGGPNYECLLQQFTSSGQVNGINGRVDMNYLYGEVETMTKSRQAVVDLVLSWEGRNEKSGSHKYIVDLYNSFDGTFPRGVKMQYDWSWCACTWSALAIKLGYTDIMPIEISCGELIKAAQKMGIWQENDGYVPKPADAILYDWDDTGKGDNTGWPEHVGTIVEVHEDAGYMVVMEGNYDDQVKKRTISINGKSIRGFITPKYTDDKVLPPAQVSGKDNKTIAREVIAGTWGKGDARKKALEAAGYTYATIQKIVNEILKPAPVKPSVTKTVTATCSAKKFNKSIAGTYKTTANLHIRNDAGKNKKSLGVIPKNAEVKCYGYYSVYENSKWLYVQTTVDGVQYTGFCSSTYLKK